MNLAHRARIERRSATEIVARLTFLDDRSAYTAFGHDEPRLTIPHLRPVVDRLRDAVLHRGRLLELAESGSDHGRVAHRSISEIHGLAEHAETAHKQRQS